MIGVGQGVVADDVNDGGDHVGGIAGDAVQEGLKPTFFCTSSCVVCWVWLACVCGVYERRREKEGTVRLIYEVVDGSGKEDGMLYV